MTLDTNNPIELRIVDPEQHQLGTFNAWRIPRAGETIRVVLYDADDTDLIAGEVSHVTWHADTSKVPSTWVVLEVEPL